jgi:hypothetical protein
VMNARAESHVPDFSSTPYEIARSMHIAAG